MSTDLDELAVALHAGIGLLARRLRQTPSPEGLSMPERSVLARLRDRGGTTGAELARAEQITPQALGNIAAALERRGLVARSPDPGDGRRILLRATETGVGVLRRRRDARAERLAGLLGAEFSGEELATLAAATPLLERIGARL